MKTSRLSPMALGLSLGVIWGLSMLIVGLLGHFFGYGKEFLMTMNSIYMISGPSIMQAILGGIAGFIDGFIGGALIAFFYNLFDCRKCCHEEKSENTDA